MKFDANSPIWLQVMHDLQRRIVMGESPPGSKLPGGRDLALAYGINPNTAARVYQELERTGLCETRRGMGTYVTEDGRRIADARLAMAESAAGVYWETMRQLGFTRKEAAAMIDGKEEE